MTHRSKSLMERFKKLLLYFRKWKLSVVFGSIRKYLGTNGCDTFFLRDDKCSRYNNTSLYRIDHKYQSEREIMLSRLYARNISIKTSTGMKTYRDSPVSISLVCFYRLRSTHPLLRGP